MQEAPRIITKPDECDPTYHRFYSLDPIGVESTGAVLVISVCANCGKVLTYRDSIFEKEK